ncbi:MAG: hypothetical protein M0R46_09845 [Candidatus Muirbacterium halophilum]|nr:hypothetical protein [Candidatus Muirbacterium halophilum]
MGIIKLYHQELDNQNNYEFLNADELTANTYNNFFTLIKSLDGKFLLSKNSFTLSSYWTKEKLEMYTKEQNLEIYFVSDSEFVQLPLYKQKCLFGKYSGYSWEDIPQNYLHWALDETLEGTQYHNLVYAEIKRRAENPFFNFDPEKSSIAFGKFKDTIWAQLDDNYLQWISNTFEKNTQEKMYADATIRFKEYSKITKKSRI